MQIPRFARDDNSRKVALVHHFAMALPKALLRALCVSAVSQLYPAYIPITRSIALRHTAQNVLCRVNIMQSTSGR